MFLRFKRLLLGQTNIYTSDLELIIIRRKIYGSSEARARDVLCVRQTPPSKHETLV